MARHAQMLGDSAAGHEAYGTGVFLIRPDGYVGWAGATADGLAQYAARVGALES